jgi:excisionase family DNA binding protein
MRTSDSEIENRSSASSQACALAPDNETRPTRNDGAPEQFEPLLDSVAAAKLLQIHPKTLQKMARVGRIPAHCVVGLWRFRASELDAWLKTEVSSKSHSRSN